jgi:hypothetical protein
MWVGIGFRIRATAPCPTGQRRVQSVVDRCLDPTTHDSHSWRLALFDGLQAAGDVLHERRESFRFRGGGRSTSTTGRSR